MHPNFSENRQPNRSENDKNKVMLFLWKMNFHFQFHLYGFGRKNLLCHLCLHIWSGRFFTFSRTLRLCFMVRNLEKLLAVPMVYKKKSWKNLLVESFSNWNRITQGMYKNRVNIDRNIFKFPTIKSSQRDNPEWEISNMYII